MRKLQAEPLPEAGRGLQLFKKVQTKTVWRMSVGSVKEKEDVGLQERYL